MILVVGATGELGTMVVRKLVAQGATVRAFARPDSAYQHLLIDGVQLAFGDLREMNSVNEACQGVEAVIATANTVIPRKRGYSFKLDEAQGYRNLVAACHSQGVRHFVFISVPETPVELRMPAFRYKRLVEQQLQESGIPYTIFRSSLLMNDWLPLFGSRMLLQGSEAATLHRPFWFSQSYLKLVGNMIDRHGLALIPGNGKARHAFVTKDNAADFMVRAIHHPQAKNQVFDLGGPEILSFDEAIEVFGRALGRQIRPLHAPAALFSVFCRALMPLSPAAANLMGMNWYVASFETLYKMDELAPMFGVELTRMEEFLLGKVSLTERQEVPALARPTA